MSKLDEYAGHYELGNGVYGTFHVVDDTLYGLVSQVPELPLYVSGPDAFRIVPKNPEFAFELLFLRDDNGRIDRVEMTQAKTETHHVGPKLHLDAKPLEGELAGLNGQWKGTIGFPAKIGIELRLFADKGGEIDGYLSLPGQRAYYLPIQAIEVEDKSFSITSVEGGPTFEGKLKRKGDEVAAIKGQWTFRGKTNKLNFKPA